MNRAIPLGEIIRIKKGRKAAKVFERPTNGLPPYLQIDEVRGATPTKVAEDSKGVEVTLEDLCIVWDGANAGTIGYGVSGLIGSTVARMRLICPQEWETGFLGRFLESKFREINDHAKARGATIPHVDKMMLEQILVPKLALEEQRRIVAILDKSDAVCQEWGRALVLADDFLRAVFLETFGDPVGNPHKWPINYVGDLGDVQGGLQVSKKRDSLPLRLPYLRVANVYRNRLMLSEIKEIGLTQAEFRRTQLKSGDVLIVEGHGNPGEIGRTSVWNGSIDKCVHQNHLIRFRADRTAISPIYLSRLLNSKDGRLQLIAAGRTTSGLNTISTKKVKDVAIPVPPIKQQLEFETFAAKQEQAAKYISHARDEAVILFASLSQRVFSERI